MSKIIHICKWVSFAISIVAIVEETPSYLKGRDLYKCAIAYHDCIQTLKKLSSSRFVF